MTGVQTCALPISQMTVGRQQPGGEAIAVLNLDAQPPEEAINEVRTNSHISSLSVVKLPPEGEMPVWFGRVRNDEGLISND